MPVFWFDFRIHGHKGFSHYLIQTWIQNPIRAHFKVTHLFKYNKTLCIDMIIFLRHVLFSRQERHSPFTYACTHARKHICTKTTEWIKPSCHLKCFLLELTKTKSVIYAENRISKFAVCLEQRHLNLKWLEHNVHFYNPLNSLNNCNCVLARTNTHQMKIALNSEKALLSTWSHK